MDETLLAAYRATDYRVRHSSGGYCSIRVDQPLPETLREVAGNACWGCITAWNPDSRPQLPATNHAAQQNLLKTLLAMPETRRVIAGIGVGHGWSEASLFVLGPGTAQLDALALQFGQNAYVHGMAAGCARLRLVSDQPPHGQAG